MDNVQRIMDNVGYKKLRQALLWFTVIIIAISTLILSSQLPCGQHSIIHSQAAEGGEVYTIRLYSLRFSDNDAPGITGVIGMKYAVTLKQDGSKEQPIGLSLYYNSTGTEKYLSVKKGNYSQGEKRGDYLEFKMKDYSALKSWIVMYESRGYGITGPNAALDVSISGEFFSYTEIFKKAPKTHVYDGNDKALYHLPDGIRRVWQYVGMGMELQWYIGRRHYNG